MAHIKQLVVYCRFRWTRNRSGRHGMLNILYVATLTAWERLLSTLSSRYWLRPVRTALLSYGTSRKPFRPKSMYLSLFSVLATFNILFYFCTFVLFLQVSFPGCRTCLYVPRSYRTSSLFSYELLGRAVFQWWTWRFFTVLEYPRVKYRSVRFVW